MTNNLLKGKKGLIMGVANDHSIAWGIAKEAADQGAELAFTYMGENIEKRIRPLAQSIGQDFLMQCDVSDSASMDAVFEEIKQKWGKLDFVVHAIAFSDKNQLKGRYVDTTKENFANSLLISCYSFTEVCRRASELMTDGGSCVTLTYYGAEKYLPNYNVMGVAKAALESSVRYIANDLGPLNIRVNAISSGTVKTLAASGIGDFKQILNWTEYNAPLERNVTLEDVGRTGVYLVSDLSSGVTGECLHVDAGYHTIGMVRFTHTKESAEVLYRFKMNES